MHALMCGAAMVWRGVRGVAAAWIDGAALAGMIFHAARRGVGAGWSRAKTGGDMSARRGSGVRMSAARPHVLMSSSPIRLVTAHALPPHAHAHALAPPLMHLYMRLDVSASVSCLVRVLLHGSTAPPCAACSSRLYRCIRSYMRVCIYTILWRFCRSLMQN